MHRFVPASVLLASLITACSAAPSTEDTSPLATTEDPLIGGVAADSAALDAVGSLVTISRWSGSTSESYGSPFCTATLISPRQVLTAEHCVQAMGAYQEFGFALGADGRRPKRVVSVVATEIERAVAGGRLALGSDVAVLHLEKPITDVVPVAIGTLAEADVGQRFVALGYGSQDIQGNAYTRRAGSLTLGGLSGRVLELAFGSFEAFKAAVPDIEEFRWQVGDVNTPEGERRARDIFESQVLLDGYEVFVGNAAGDAQACHGDSGGPLIRTVNGKRTTYGVTSWGNHKFGSFCAFGAVYGSFGPKAMETITKALAWVDPCADLTTLGECKGDVASRCAAKSEGDRRPLVTDCAELGLTCGRATGGQVACVTK